MLIKEVAPEVLPVPATAHSPNSKLPVLVYRGALVDPTADEAVAGMAANRWVKGGHWKISGEKLAHTAHYHSVTHEAYTVLHGHGTYVLGKSPLDPDVDGSGRPVGVTFTARAGDVFLFPSGVTHFVQECSSEYEIIGFYQLSGLNTSEEPYDMEYALDSVEVTNEKRKKCDLVPTPSHDPVHGEHGPIKDLWRRC